MVEQSNVLKLVYTFFLGILLATFIGVGVNTFYPGPTAPEYPNEKQINYEKEPSAEQIAAQSNYEKQARAYEKSLQPYNRNVSIINLTAAVLLLVISLFVSKKVNFIADGIMLGGLFTLLYGLIRGFASQDSKYIFGVVAIALIIVFYLGYSRFIATKSPSKTS